MRLPLTLGAALLTWPCWTAAEPRGTTPRPAEARAQFGVIVLAAQDLASVWGAGRNLRGGLQSWDRRWRTRLRSLGRVVLAGGRSCEAREVAALVDGTAGAVWNARMFVFSEQTASLVPLARELAARRLLADEAARRRGSASSCDELPELTEIESSLAAEGGASPLGALFEVARRGRPASRDP